jgi:predicted flavoprotein YhiN
MKITVIGGGSAGFMAAEAANAGPRIYERGYERGFVDRFLRSE